MTEESISGEAKSEWKALLSPGIMKAVLIGSSIAILGQFMGVNAVLYYGPEIFKEAGLASGDALFSQVLVGVVNMVTTVIALLILDKVGRKNLVYWGVSGTFFLFALMCIPYLLIMWKLVPETTGKSLEEIERWWTGKHQIFIVIVEQFRFFS